MILYYSATGNSRHVAKMLAQRTGEVPQSVIDLMRHEEYAVSLGEGERLVVVTPTYHWGLPHAMRLFLDRCNVTGAGGNQTEGERRAELARAFPSRSEVDGVNRALAVATYGTTSGAACRMAARRLRAKGVFGEVLTASVKMPDTWTPTFDLTDTTRNAALNAKADKTVLQLADDIEAGRKPKNGEYLPVAVCYIANRWAYHFTRRTSHLKLTEGCIGCGLCSRICSAQVIEMRDGHPVWTAPRCEMCLACLHHCPKFAIQYENRTQHHGQYVHPDKK